jgi:hypothetical protein
MVTINFFLCESDTIAAKRVILETFCKVVSFYEALQFLKNFSSKIWYKKTKFFIEIHLAFYKLPQVF